MIQNESIRCDKCRMRKGPGWEMEKLKLSNCDESVSRGRMTGTKGRRTGTIGTKERRNEGTRNPMDSSK